MHPSSAPQYSEVGRSASQTTATVSVTGPPLDAVSTSAAVRWPSVAESAEGRRTEDWLPLALEGLRDGVLIRQAGMIRACNARARELLGLPSVPLNVADFIQACAPLTRADGEPYSADVCPCHAAWRTGGVQAAEFYRRQADGTLLWLSVQARPVARADEPPAAVTIQVSDITEQRLCVQRWREAQRDNERLVKDSYHRIKNNLQFVCSLLHLQSRLLADQRLVDLFRQSEHRVRTLALIYEKLYRARDLGRVAFTDFAVMLTTYLQRCYRADPDRITLSVNGPALHLSIERAVPCGLIVLELVSNSLKYAFPGERAGRVWVELEREGARYRLHVGDDGVGLPDSVDAENPDSLGLQLVVALADQLGGRLALQRRPGAVCTIAFTEAEPGALG